MLVIGDVEGLPDLSWVGAAFCAAVWFVGAFLIIYRSAVAFEGRTSVPSLVGAALLLASWTLVLTWLALASLPD